jgi:hypothetical protein
MQLTNASTVVNASYTGSFAFDLELATAGADPARLATVESTLDHMVTAGQPPAGKYMTACAWGLAKGNKAAPASAEAFIRSRLDDVKEGAPRAVAFKTTVTAVGAHRYRVACRADDHVPAIVGNREKNARLNELDAKSYSFPISLPQSVTITLQADPGADVRVDSPQVVRAGTLSLEFAPLKEPPQISPKYASLGADGTLRVLEVGAVWEYREVSSANLVEDGFTLVPGPDPTTPLYIKTLPSGSPYRRVEWRRIDSLSDYYRNQANLPSFKSWSDAADIVISGTPLAGELSGMPQRYRIEIDTSAYVPRSYMYNYVGVDSQEPVFGDDVRWRGQQENSLVNFSQGDRHRVWTLDAARALGIVSDLSQGLNFNTIIAKRPTVALHLE